MRKYVLCSSRSTRRAACLKARYKNCNSIVGTCLLFYLLHRLSGQTLTIFYLPSPQTPTRMLFSFPTYKITFIIFYLEKNNISYNFQFDHLHVSLVIIKNVKVFICITMLYCYAAFRFIVSYSKTTRRTRVYQQNNNIHISLR